MNQYVIVFQQQSLNMDDTLIFTHSTTITHIKLLPGYKFLLTSQTQLSIFNIENAKPTHKISLAADVMPIQTWTIQNHKKKEDNQNKKMMIIVQGKMGYNFVYTYCEENGFDVVRRYKTDVCGFCKMGQIGDCVVGINQEEKAVIVYDIMSGELKCKAVFDEQKLCQSISCIYAEKIQNNQAQFRLFTAQQGCHIHKFQPTFQIQDNLLQSSDTITLPNNNQIRMILSMTLNKNLLYCIMRRYQNLCIVNTQPKMTIHKLIDCKFSMPRNLFFFNNQIFISDGNKIVKLSENKEQGTQPKMKTIGQVKQSKTIQFMELAAIEKVIYGCTQQKQFFYHQL